MLTCPNCRKALIHCQNEMGNFWHCGECDGSALTLSLLRKFVDKNTINQLWQSSRQFEHVRKRDCPGCQNRMEEVPLQLPIGLRHIDVCDRCQFIWLDKGEWDDLPDVAIEVTPPDLVRKAPVELRERVGLERIKRIKEVADENRGPGPQQWWQWLPALLLMPIEEGQPTRGAKSIAVWCIAAIILLISLASFDNLQSVVQSFGLIPAEATRLGGLTLFSSFFIHGGVLHLIGNLYFLLIFGDNVEHFLGSLKCILLIVLATLGGDLLHIALDPQSTIPCVGASGGISGVMAYYALKFPKSKISLLIFYWPGAWLRLSARWMFAIWVAQQCFVMWKQANGFSSVSGAAHLGGVVVGIIFWLITREKLAFPKGTRGSFFER